MLEDGKSFLVEFLEAGLENGEIFVVFAGAAVIENFGFLETTFNIGFGDIEDDGGFDFVAGTCGDRHDLVFFAVPAADGGKNEGVFEKVRAFKIGKDPFIEEIGGDEGTLSGVVFFEFGFHVADNHARGNEFGI